MGEGGVVEGEADVEGDDGVEAEGFVHGILESDIRRDFKLELDV